MYLHRYSTSATHHPCRQNRAAAVCRSLWCRGEDRPGRRTEDVRGRPSSSAPCHLVPGSSRGLRDSRDREQALTSLRTPSSSKIRWPKELLRLLCNERAYACAFIHRALGNSTATAHVAMFQYEKRVLNTPLRIHCRY